MYNPSEISEIIKSYAQKKKVSIKQLLEDCKINKGFIYDLEHKSTYPSIDKMAKIANYFEVPVDFLLGTGAFSDWDKLKIKENKDAVIDFLLRFNPGLKTKLNFDLNNDEETFINILNLFIEKVKIDEKKGITLYPKFFLDDETAEKINDETKKAMEIYIKNNYGNGQQAINGNVTVNNAPAPDKKDTLTEQFMQKFEELDFDDKVDVMQYVKNKK